MKRMAELKGVITIAAIAAAATVFVLSYRPENTRFTHAVTETPRYKAVNASSVCMDSDTVKKTPQIPIKVDGKTYYGCCHGCVWRIKADPSLRYASDPLTGHRVDKAAAVVLEGEGSKALYFESEKTARMYAGRQR